MNEVISFTFFRYRGVVMALNHNVKEFDDSAILPVTECIQYSKFPDLMDAAVLDLHTKIDGKWIWSPEAGWQNSPLSPREELACELALHR